jgi:hypothetical protein
MPFAALRSTRASLARFLLLLVTSSALLLLPVAGASAAAPVVTAAPTVSGVANVLQTLTCLPGTWDQAATYTYEWLGDDTPIFGATAATWTVPTVALGHRIACRVTATNAEPAAGVATSAPIVPTRGAQVITGNFVTATGVAKACGVSIARACLERRAANGSVMVGGTLTPGRPGAKVVVVFERQRGKAWVLSMTRTATISALGTYSVSIPSKFFAGVMWRARTRAPQTDVYDLASSALRFVRVA